LPAAALRDASLRSASLRFAAGKTVGEAGEIPLFFTLIPILALLSNYDQENCLTNVGTEGTDSGGKWATNSGSKWATDSGGMWVQLSPVTGTLDSVTGLVAQ
jgi:hypothetical protein